MSFETTSVRTVAVPSPMVKASLHEVGLPVAASSATKFTASCSAPAAPSGGLTAEKVPPAKTVPLAWAIAHTTPLGCHVGRLSAVNATGAVMADACGISTRPIPVPATGQ